jgi:hypothetical protein
MVSLLFLWKNEVNLFSWWKQIKIVSVPTSEIQSGLLLMEKLMRLTPDSQQKFYSSLQG